MKNDAGMLMDICRYISSNYLDLKTEFEEVNNLLFVAERYSVAYLKKELVEFHFKVSAKTGYLWTTSMLVVRLEKVNEDTKEEFFQGVNIFNIYNVLLDEIRKGNVLNFVWNTRKKLQYIMYEIERIATAKEMTKKLAILKGMIAYY